MADCPHRGEREPAGIATVPISSTWAEWGGVPKPPYLFSLRVRTGVGQTRELSMAHWPWHSPLAQGPGL